MWLVGFKELWDGDGCLDTYSFISSLGLWWIDRKVGGDLVGGEGCGILLCV